MKRWIVLSIVLMIGVLGLGLSIQAVRTYRTYGEWGLTAPETPPRIDALGRQYDRGDSTSARSIPDGFVEKGTTDGGATVIAPSRARPQPVVIYVRDGDGSVWEYALVGGP